MLASIIFLRYNVLKGKKLLFAWLRSGDGVVSTTVDYISGIGCAVSAYGSKLLAVRPALRSAAKIWRWFPVFCAYIDHRTV